MLVPVSVVATLEVVTVSTRSSVTVAVMVAATS
jgi:hypothetical protein